MEGWRNHNYKINMNGVLVQDNYINVYYCKCKTELYVNLMLTNQYWPEYESQ